jgi:hypothetical protein
MAAPSNVRIGVGDHWSSGSPSFAETGDRMPTAGNLSPTERLT